MWIPAGIHHRTKHFYFKIKTKNARRLDCAYHFWLLFLDQPDTFVFEILFFHIYNIIITKYKME